MTNLKGSATLRFVIPTEVFMACGPPKVMKIAGRPAVRFTGNRT
jgi:hypothetical protein